MNNPFSAVLLAKLPAEPRYCEEAGDFRIETMRHLLHRIAILKVAMVRVAKLAALASRPARSHRIVTIDAELAESPAPGQPPKRP
jgi:hypothetical protein